ncbi:Wadjet anti-phage system protein JetD domain-containing protein [Paenibacillus albidus]|nr:Wadjet anti-phage system protein JetD domain-containing protein [Paenibacillus albidus]
MLLQVLEQRFGAVRRSRRKVELTSLEKDLIRSFGAPVDYERAGGFQSMASCLEELAAEGCLTPVKSSSKSFKSPFIHTRYWLAESLPLQAGWDHSAMLSLRKKLDLDYFEKHPEGQTPETWSRLERLYTFMLLAESREYITREERSLELFGQEKWLSEPEGRQLLTRLGLSLDSLKAVNAHEPFIYYIRHSQTVRNILIAENKSFFHSSKRLICSGLSICGLSVDLLIYGEGWKIDRSLLFLEEIEIDPGQVSLYYAGDMDKAGWNIYGKLKFSYPELNLQLAAPIYEQMMYYGEFGYPYDNDKEQLCNPAHLELVRQELSAYPELLRYAEWLLAVNLRVPQEVLNYEVMARLAQE